MTAARILAAGVTLASALTMLGGLAGSTITVGLAGAVMFAANVAVLAGVGSGCPALSPESHTCSEHAAHAPPHKHYDVGWWWP